MTTKIEEEMVGIGKQHVVWENFRGGSLANTKFVGNGKRGGRNLYVSWLQEGLIYESNILLAVQQVAFSP